MSNTGHQYIGHGTGRKVEDPSCILCTGMDLRDEWYGSMQVPISMLMLSGSGTIRYLQSSREGGPAFNFSSRASFCIIVGRVLVFPCIGVMWWKLLYAGGMRSPAELDLVVLINSAVPTAQNIIMLLLVFCPTPQYGEALAYIILWQYLIAIPLLILNISIFLTMVRQVHSVV